MVLDPGYVKAVGMMFSSVFTDSISLHLEFFPLEGNAFAQQPAMVRKVRTISLGKPGEKAATFPEVSFTDLSGDGRADLLIQTGPDRFELFPATGENQLFSKKPRKYSVKTQNE